MLHALCEYSDRPRQQQRRARYDRRIRGFPFHSRSLLALSFLLPVSFQFFAFRLFFAHRGCCLAIALPMSLLSSFWVGINLFKITCQSFNTRVVVYYSVHSENFGNFKKNRTTNKQKKATLRGISSSLSASRFAGKAF